MRIPVLLVLIFPLAGQTPPLAPSETKPAAAAPEQKPAASESWFSGSVDVGYRWRTDVGGSFNTYRSVVDLGEGPKMLGAEFTILDPSKHFLDRIDVRAYNWGDDPYATLHVSARKARRYDFTADYRNMAYYNVLPSFADPLLARGIVLNERSFDIRRRMSSFNLDLLPGNWLMPYLAFDRNSGSGDGVTTFVSDGNEYPLPDKVRDSTNNYRGGLRLELRRFHATIEQGGTTFKDDQRVFSSSSSTNRGNNNTALFGQSLFLTSLQQAYGIRGTSVYSKGLLTASPVSWADFYGQFLFSQPRNEITYQQFDTGNLAFLNQALLFTGQQYLLSAQANLPRTSGSFGVEVRPFRRMRVIESWLTDRLHNAAASSASQLITPVSAAQPQPPSQSTRLVSNYNHEQVDLLLELSKKLKVRGGYRYVWGDAGTLVLPVAGLLVPDAGKLRRNVGIGGFTFRPGQKLLVSGEVEAAAGDQSYFRTSLNDYQKMHARARYQALANLSVSADFNLLNNQNPATGIRYDYLARQSSLSFLWSPHAGKRFTIQGDYMRATVRSNISYFIPQVLQAARSFYRDNAHLGSAILDVVLPGYGKRAGRLSLGGSWLISSGRRSTSYYQPMAKLAVPLTAHVAWVSDWRYYGFGEAFYSFEGFRTHLISTGLRLTK